MKNQDLGTLVVTFEFKAFNGVVFNQSVLLDDIEQLKLFAEQLYKRGIYRYTCELAKTPEQCLQFVDIMQQE